MNYVILNIDSGRIIAIYQSTVDQLTTFRKFERSKLGNETAED